MKYYKMHGLSNQFYVFDMRHSESYNINDLFSFTDKKFDQLIIIKKSDRADCFMEIYNIDGSKVEACGNATRCVAKILCLESEITQLKIETVNRVLIVEKHDKQFKVMMGKAHLNWQEIPLVKPLTNNDLNLLDNDKFTYSHCVNIGNPHIVFFTEDIVKVNLAQEVSWIEKHSYFPQSINVNIAQIIDSQTISLKTWERGAGATKSCGTGACATFFAAYKDKKVKDSANIIMQGGTLKISVNDAEEIYMQGDAVLEEEFLL